MNNQGLCPICGERIRLTGQHTSNGRLIGTCGDAFTLRQWIGDENCAPQLKIFGDEKCVVSLAALEAAARHFARVHKRLKNDDSESEVIITHPDNHTPRKTLIPAEFAGAGKEAP